MCFLELFQDLINDKCTILMANSFNYQSFLQGRALGRISSSVLDVLNFVYNNIGNLFSFILKYITFFRRERWRFF